jgi:hypothetical protein
VARVAGLVGVAALGPVIGSHLSVSKFHLALGGAAVLLALAGTLGATLIRNPTRLVLAAECSGGQIVGSAHDAAGCRDESAVSSTPVWGPREKARAAS